MSLPQGEARGCRRGRDTPFTIGDLARRTGLTAKAIRFYSDTGIMPPTDRSPVGYRRYDTGALARPDLVRTLRAWPGARPCRHPAGGGPEGLGAPRRSRTRRRPGGTDPHPATAMCGAASGGRTGLHPRGNGPDAQACQAFRRRTQAPRHRLHR
ncbi:hypothetical protein AV521_45660 [Streptomyces sp. IMTB 2501]|nr:hypothetical protein AV521_45660 [Streptomyces sp. IMTB 2501]